MSPQKTKDDDGDGDRGCLFIIGLAIVGICIGNIYGAAAGWLFIGLSILLVALLSPRSA